MNLICKSAFGAAFTVIAMNNQASAQCTGNACGDLVVQNQNNCVVLVNKNGSKSIHIVSGSVPSSVYDVAAGSQSVPNVIFGTTCHRTWFSKFSANYN